MPENFFVDETPVEPKAAEVASKEESRLAAETRKKQPSSASLKSETNGPCKENGGRNGLDSGKDEEKKTTKSASAEAQKKKKNELTFEEEWQFGRSGGGEAVDSSNNAGKSGDLKADGDRVTRRGVKRGPRAKTKKGVAARGKPADGEKQVRECSNLDSTIFHCERVIALHLGRPLLLSIFGENYNE